LHIVLQAGSNVVLKRMNRKYTRQIFLESVDKLKKASPDFTFTTDVIVGFPGETDSDFQETLEVMQNVKFAKIHMFPYSPRERTRAALFPNQIPKNIIHFRKNELLRLSEQLCYELRSTFIGRTMEILTEHHDEEGSVGHTSNFLCVKVPGVQFSANHLLAVKLIENSPEALIGVPA
jgi:threonylcarbamoyladenosine tRNA methylthiotransferase MtaB